ncbi:CDP-glycerol glycerophosphotransferase family protein [Segatella copri]|uniref:CDP-glycerol:poly(Glycerophosphate) glycerophosphotransferase n=1 Tax=Segatella copri DSM 18205 TaxID=537011 RepID=D1PFF0_9BACT|nr:CDP-glycerol glycerophosphotransferase family protein [Segatella copri]EFB34523.1 CDP-glycerol:poly(glycerophosphate) glycerophosphotransferase [Segatella copri DSM 18205]MCW4097695.1 CDP-glycerol glycerophosphotransferase family protein [Segatella copri]MQP20715.1 hypothetical protein [Segatella copri DSM 18205]UEA44412.1 CDP-glycerol glycerophosphotransferase family protein [Segatella copri DSM 18205]
MKIKSIKNDLLEIFCHIICRPNKKNVFFTSLGGQYNDNPKYISEKLHEMYPDINVIWAISNRSKQNDIPDYVKRVNFQSLKYYYYKNSSKVVVDNGAGFYLTETRNPVIFWLKKLLKNNQQFNLSTWHGNPIKHIGAQIPGNESWSKKTINTSSDILIAGCQKVKEIFESAFIGLMPVLLIGTPRTDILFNCNEDTKIRLKKKLGLPLDKNIILYAPTYRNTPEDSGVIQMSMIDFGRLFKTLHDKFNGDWVFVFRVHNMVLEVINTSKEIENIDDNDRIINGNQFDDMNEYLAAADILLSDYSGCVYDVALTDKPCFLFAHDRENYENRERGLYLPLTSFPYDFYDSFEALLNGVQNYQPDSCKIRRKEFLTMIGNVEDGNSAINVIKRIIEPKIL